MTEEDTMRHLKVRNIMSLATEIIEVFLGIMLTVAVAICAIQLVPELFHLKVNIESIEVFRGYLEAIFTLVIGVEALRMIYKHSPGSAIEVLLYAIARELIVKETTPLENLISITSIAILFAVRKFLFVPAFGAHLPSSVRDMIRNKTLSPDVAEMLEPAITQAEEEEEEDILEQEEEAVGQEEARKLRTS